MCFFVCVSELAGAYDSCVVYQLEHDVAPRPLYYYPADVARYAKTEAGAAAAASNLTYVDV